VVVGLVVDVVLVVVLVEQGTVVVVDEVPTELVVDVVGRVDVMEAAGSVVVGVVAASMTPGDFADGTTVAVAASGNADDSDTMPTADAVSRPAHRRIVPSSLPSRRAGIADSRMFAPTRVTGRANARTAQVTATTRTGERFATDASEDDMIWRLRLGPVVRFPPRRVVTRSSCWRHAELT